MARTTGTLPARVAGSLYARQLEMTLLVYQGCGFLTSVLIARGLGPSGRGHYTVFIIWSQLVGFVATLSLDKALIVKGRPLPDSSRLALFRLVLQCASFSCSVVVVASLILVAPRLFPQDYALQALFAVSVVLTVIGELTTGWLLLTDRRMTYLKYRVLQPLTGALVIGALFVSGLVDQLPSNGQIHAVVCALPISFLFSIYLVWRKQQHTFRGVLSSPTAVNRLTTLSFAGRTQVANLLQYANQRLDLILLPLHYSASDVGLYAVAVSAPQIVVFLGSAGVVRGLTGESRAAGRSAVLISGLFVAFLALASSWILRTVYGSDYSSAAPVMSILLVGAVAGYLLQLNVGRLLGTGRVNAVVLTQLCGAGTFAAGFYCSNDLTGVAASNAASSWIAWAVSYVAIKRMSTTDQ